MNAGIRPRSASMHGNGAIVGSPGSQIPSIVT
jgi:hypothetical protein